MSNATTKAKTAKGFNLSCPFCGISDDPPSDDGTFSVDLACLDKIVCTSCNVEFTATEAVAKVTWQLKGWEKVARWVEVGRGLANEVTEA